MCTPPLVPPSLLSGLHICVGSHPRPVSSVWVSEPLPWSAELQAFAHHGRPLPRFQVTLCFGEEFPDPQRQRKLITAHVSVRLPSRESGQGPT